MSPKGLLTLQAYDLEATGSVEGRPEEADTGCLPSDGTVLWWRTGTLGPGSQL